MFALNDKLGDLLLNLGSEILGIAVTVAVVEHLFERRRRQDEARRLAWEALHELDHAVWVWQGGSRSFDMGELQELLHHAHQDDPVPDFTEALFLRMGSKAENTLRTKRDIMHECPPLKQAMNELRPLASLRDGTHREATDIPIALSRATAHLSAVLKGQWTDGFRPTVIRDASVEAQKWRYLGQGIPPTKQPKIIL